MGGIGSGLGLSKLINVKDLIKRQTDPLKKVMSKKTDAKDLEFEKVSAYSNLGTLLSNFKDSLKGFRAGFNNSLDRKIATSQTSDVGEGTDYVKVSASDEATGSSFNVSVNKLAKPASLVLQFNDGTNDSAFNFGAPNLDGVLQLKIGTSQYATIGIDAGDSITNIVDKINNELSTQGIKAKADYNHNAAGTAYIDITGNAGESDAISLGTYAATPGTSNCINSKSSAAHQKAQITVTIGGVSQIHTSDSNVFKDVRKGVDITAQKVNAPGKDQTVSMVADSTKLVSDLSKMREAYNNLKAFTASQSEKETVDPDNPSKKIRPPLYGSTELYQAKDALLQIESAVGDKSLESLLGIGFETNLSIDAPAGTKFMTVVDEQKLVNSIEDMDKIKNLFSDLWKVTPQGVVGSSSMNVTSLDGRLPAHLQNAAITMDVTLDAAGSVTKAEATLPDGYKVTGTYDPASKKVSFGSDSLLQYLNLSFDAGTENSKTVQFSVTASNGIADLASKKSDELLEVRISSGGVLKNSIEAAADKVKERLTKQTEEINKLRDKINSIKEKAKQDMMAINTMDIMGGILAKHIQGMFNPS